MGRTNGQVQILAPDVETSRRQAFIFAQGDAVEIVSSVVMVNVSGRGLGGLIDDIRASIDAGVKLPEGYHVVYGGQFESQAEDTRTIGVLGGVVIAGIFLLLFMAFRSLRSTLAIL